MISSGNLIWLLWKWGQGGKKQTWVPNGADKSSKVEHGSEGSKAPIFPLTWLSVILPYRNELAGVQTWGLGHHALQVITAG